MKNKNTLIGFILIAIILFGWMYFMTPTKEQMAEQQRIQDSIRRARIEEARLDSIRLANQQSQTETIVNLMIDSTQLAEMDSAAIEQYQYNVLRDKYGVFASATMGEEKTITIENHLQKLTFSTKGGFLKQVELKDYKTYDSLPLYSFEPETALFDLTFFSQNRIVNTSQFYFKPTLTVSHTTAVT